MPRASIIIPCYNAERYLSETLESVLAQTMRDFEVVCVDDGSTDGTLRVLQDYALNDERIRVISQENGGEGPARDAGLAAATGEWLYCLDADDLIAPTMLDDAVGCGERTDADVVIFRVQLMDNETGVRTPFRWCFDTGWLPEGTEVFDPHEYPDRILNSFQNWCANKLVRASFARERGLRIQHVHRTADLLFSCRALTEAHRIALLDRTLHTYRVNNPESALFTSDAWPLDFYEAFLALREALEEAGTWELYRRSFANWAIEGVAGNLRRSRSQEAFETIARTMRKGGLERLAFPTVAREDADNPCQWDVCQAILESEPTLLPLRLIRVLGQQEERLDAILQERDREIGRLRSEVDRINAEVDRRDREIAELWHHNEAMRESVSYRLGRVMTAPLRIARNRIRTKE